MKKDIILGLITIVVLTLVSAKDYKPYQPFDSQLDTGMIHFSIIYIG